MTQVQSSTRKHYKQLSEAERGQIEASLKDGLSTAQIAQRLGRARSTICREIKRGTTLQRHSNYLFYRQYFADTGQANYLKHRSHCHSKPLTRNCWLFFSMLEKELKKPYRSQSIASFTAHFKRIHPDKPTPSVTTVYRYIDQGLLNLRNIDLPQKLRRRVKNKTHTHSRKPRKDLGLSIEERPLEVEQRQTLGHWEADLVKGVRRASEPALLTLTERKTRYEILIKLPDYHSQTCFKATEKVVKQMPQLFKTITFDNGAEFSHQSHLSQSISYFAHPSAPWERGSNERANGMIREFFPKGHSLKQVTAAEVQLVQDALNDKYRRILGYHSAKEALKSELDRAEYLNS